MIVNQANLRGLSMTYSAAYNKGFEETANHYQEIATVVPSSSASQAYKWLGQLPQMRVWVGEKEIQSIAANAYEIENKPFEMTVAVSKNDIEDDIYGVYTPLMQNMGSSAKQHPDELAFGALMNGFKEKCYDKKPFFAEDHKIGDKTYSNKTNLPLTPTSFKATRALMMSLVGDKGKSLKLVPNLLVVSPQNEEAKEMIVEADIIDGTTNVNKGLAKVLVIPDLAEHPSYWFLLCTNKFLKPIIYQKRKEYKLVSLDKDTDLPVFENGNYLYSVEGRGNAGYGFWQMAYGSTGDAVENG